jgi:Carboxypeptidase regulatory-like domain
MSSSLRLTRGFAPEIVERANMGTSISIRSWNAPSRLTFAVTIWVALAFLLPQMAPAQVVFGAIRGALVDSSGSAIVGAQVTGLNTAPCGTRTVNSDETSNVVFPALTPRPYRLTIQAAGFKLYEKAEVNPTTQEWLDLGQISMQISSMTEDVIVSAERTPVQTVSAERSTMITGEQVEEFPTLSRNVERDHTNVTIQRRQLESA